MLLISEIGEKPIDQRFTDEFLQGWMEGFTQWHAESLGVYRIFWEVKFSGIVAELGAEYTHVVHYGCLIIDVHRPSFNAMTLFPNYIEQAEENIRQHHP